MQSTELQSILKAGAVLAGSTRSEGVKDLKEVLASRLEQYFAALGQDAPDASLNTLESVQRKTAQEGLSVLERVQEILSRQPSTSTANTEPQEELLGTRDMAELRMLLSLVFKWNIDPLLASVSASIPSVTPGARRRTEVNIIDLTNVPEDFQLLADTLRRIIRLIIPQGISGPLNATLIASMVLDRHLADLLKPCFVLSWLPRSLASESVRPLDDLRPLVMHVLTMLPVAHSITALSRILLDQSTLSYVRKACTHLMSRQILRQDGVQGLLIALFSEEDVSGDDAPLEKLENVAKLLKAAPSGMDQQAYYSNVVKQLLLLLSSDKDIPQTHHRAAAFSLSRMISPDDTQTYNLVSRIVLPVIQKPFLETTQLDSELSGSSTRMSPSQAIALLQTFLTNTDPSPSLLSGLLTPIIPALYTLSAQLDHIKASDPNLKATLHGFLRTWGRLVESAEGVATLWLIVNGEGGEWNVDIAGEITRIPEDSSQSKLSLFTPEDLRKAEESGGFDMDANILDLRPDPAHFVAFLKSLDRPDVVSECFVRLLEAYRESKAAPDSDPMRTLLYLQLIVQIQNHLSSGNSSFDILKKPDHILSFIKHALETATAKPALPETAVTQGLKLKDLKIVEDEGSEDSDDEDEPSTGEGSDEDMTSTSLNLLLAILEANPDLSTTTAPILDEIFTLLESLAKEGSEMIKPLAREARMVLVARLASSSIPQDKTTSKKLGESPQETYQKALKLLQDPILPVRAHGLLLLRQLVTSRPSKTGNLEKPDLDPALVPGVLSVFMQSLQDDDSYIFLNSVQGLAAMVDGFGRDVLRSLLEAYAQGTDGVAVGAMTRQDVDTRTRIGEALGQVVRRCGNALPNYADSIIPPLARMVRTPHLPIALRTSALALLGQCVNTSAVSVILYGVDLTAAMLDILQLETVPMGRPTKAPPSDEKRTENPDEEAEPGEDKPKAFRRDNVAFQPTSKDTKIPTLRRSALHFLSLLLKAFTEQLDAEVSTSSVFVLPADIVKRARTTIGYVAATDEDLIVRVMAKEALEGLEAYMEAMLGYSESM